MEGERIMKSLYLVTLSTLLLTACGGLEHDTTPPKTTTVEVLESSHEVYFIPGGGALDKNEQSLLSGFIASIPNPGASDVELIVQESPQAGVQLHIVSKALVQAGVHPDDIHAVSGGEKADVVQVAVKSAMVKAHPRCPDWSMDATSNHYNKNMSNFGCAYHTDFARQLADPRDMVQGRGVIAQDSYRNTVALGRYRAMEPLGGAEESDILDGESASGDE
jgi:pilus assembly protein CpaD